MTGRRLRGRPSLIVSVELEGPVRAYVDAESEEQADRLAHWLANGPAEVQELARLAREAWEREAA